MDTQLYTVPERLAGYEFITLADGGDTIQQQKTVWTAYADKATLDYVVIQLGLNTIYYDHHLTAVQMIAELQDLVDTVKDDAPGITVIISTMNPAKQWWYDLLDYVGGEFSTIADADKAQADWEAINAAVRGEGANPITNVDGRAFQHTYDLDDGSGNIIAKYRNDYIHPNGWGREINYRSVRQVMADLNIIAL